VEIDKKVESIEVTHLPEKLSLGLKIRFPDVRAALRALRETDAFPATDIGLIRGIAALDGAASGSAELLSRAESWRPWRAYAAQHLWAADSAATSSKLGV
jgi:hypothetical protein